jgi:hypothetical protein
MGNSDDLGINRCAHRRPKMRPMMTNSVACIILQSGGFSPNEAVLGLIPTLNPHPFPFSIAASARSIFSTLRSSAALAFENPPAAFSFPNNSSFSAAVPCMSRMRVSKMLFLGFGSFRFRNIATSSPQPQLPFAENSPKRSFSAISRWLRGLAATTQVSQHRDSQPRR